MEDKEERHGKEERKEERKEGKKGKVKKGGKSWEEEGRGNMLSINRWTVRKTNHLSLYSILCMYSYTIIY